MGNTYLPGEALTDFPTLLRWLPDEAIKAPLWEFTADEIPHVIRERRRRWGVDDDEGLSDG